MMFGYEMMSELDLLSMKYD